MLNRNPRQALLHWFDAGLGAVRGDRAVAVALRASMPERPVRLLAMGKASVAMALGAQSVLGAQLQDGLVVTKHGYGEPLPAPFRLLEAGHPVPDADSLAAGQAVLQAVDGLPDGQELLALISGGASALVEVLPPGMTLVDLRQLNEWLLASGLAIDQINHIRQMVSCIKGGRLAARLGARPARVLLISDVPGDDPALIASGPFHPPDEVEPPPDLPPEIRTLLARFAQPFSPVPDVPHCIVASNRTAHEAVAAAATDIAVFDHGETLSGDAARMGERIVAELDSAPPGLHLWGGETTVVLPPTPGRGGRNQHLALAAAIAMAGRRDIRLLAAGTDGTDGPTRDAGALVDGDTVRRGEQHGLSARDCLVRADAGTFLEASGDLIDTGPTGTNVMDLVLALKAPAGGV